MADLLTILARPSLWLTGLALAGLVALLAGRRRLGRGLLAAGVLPLAALLAVPLDSWAAGPLENWYPHRTAFPARVDGILVLGGAQNLLISAGRGTPGLTADGERLTEVLALARTYPQARLAYSGGAVRRGWSEEAAARIFFDRFGLETRVVYENRSRDTWENAVFSRRLLAPRPGEVWVLVTSALHMPRAMAAFRAAGWTGLVADPVAYHTPGWAVWGMMRSASARLALLDAAAHEWLGLLEYRLRGRAVFAPAEE